MTTIKWGNVCAILLAAALSVVFWLLPGLDAATFTSSPRNQMFVYGVLFWVFWLYLVIKTYPLSHGYIGVDISDSIVSAIPATVAIFGIFIHFVGFWRLSGFNLVIAVMTLLVAFYDLWVLGGAAAKINRLTDEIKTER